VGPPHRPPPAFGQLPQIRRRDVGFGGEKQPWEMAGITGRESCAKVRRRVGVAGNVGGRGTRIK
jgi:hypothetical protein